jgi:hypothetical protein
LGILFWHSCRWFYSVFDSTTSGSKRGLVFSVKKKYLLESKNYKKQFLARFGRFLIKNEGFCVHFATKSPFLLSSLQQ